MATRTAPALDRPTGDPTPGCVALGSPPLCPGPSKPMTISVRLPGLLLVLALATAVPAHAATLTVTIDGVHDDRGHVRVAVCQKAQFLSENCTYHAIVSARAGQVVVAIPGIRPGVYAVAAYQDATDAGHLRRGLFGIPKDGTGFSRNPSLALGPPGFAQCALRIGPQDASVTVPLHYF